MGYLEQNPDNLALLTDAAGAALSEGELETAQSLIERCRAQGGQSPALDNLTGLIDMAAGRFAEAAQRFETLLASAPADPGLRFNLAWCRAMARDFEGAVELIDDTVVAVIPKAAIFHVQTLHHLGRMEDALACGLGYAERFPDDRMLTGALAIAALDLGDDDLARAYAEKAGAGSAEGLSTLGMLVLQEHRVEDAMALFDQALAARPEDPRALLGSGLGLMAQGKAAEAAQTLTRTAEGFGDHLGSWIAAGWAEFVSGDQAAARQKFERALAIDAAFAESHGSLAVCDVMEGQLDSARRRIEIAFRLDRQCFSATLAKSLLVAAEGDPAAAEKIFQSALSSPITPGGMTLAQAIIGLKAGRLPV